jgi:hypothetical protein
LVLRVSVHFGRTRQSRYKTGENGNNIFNKHKPNTWLHIKLWSNITCMKYLGASNALKGKQSRHLKHTLCTCWWPVRPKLVVK